MKLVSEPLPKARAGRPKGGSKYDAVVREFVEGVADAARVEAGDMPLATLSGGLHRSIRELGLADAVRVARREGAAYLVRMDSLK